MYENMSFLSQDGINLYKYQEKDSLFKLIIVFTFYQKNGTKDGVCVLCLYIYKEHKQIYQDNPHKLPH